MDLNGNLKLVFVRPVGKNNDDLYEYDLLFSEYPEEVWSLYWDDPNPSSCGDLTPDATTYDVVKRIGVNYELTTIQNTSCYSMEHAMQRIVALSWINIENLEEETKLMNVPFYPNISVGWDNNVRFNKFIPGVVKNNTPENFRIACEKVKKFADESMEKGVMKVPFITVNSWNEWTETSYLQPDDLYGYGYLEAIKEVFDK